MVDMLAAMPRPASYGFEPRGLSTDGETAFSDQPFEDISPEGVDRNQIRWMLSLTPAERLEVLQDFVDTFAKGSPMSRSLSFHQMLSVLMTHQVEFLVVGGAAALMHGAPISTLDLGILYSKRVDNIARLESALLALDAVYNDPAGRHIRPDRNRLSTMRVHLLRTPLGLLDVHSTVGAGSAFEDLEPRSQLVDVQELTVRVLDLDAVIETKEQANRPKDLAALPVLREALRRRGS